VPRLTGQPSPASDRVEEGSTDSAETVRELEALGARKLTLGPLDAAAVHQVVSDVLAAPPDQSLLRMAEGTAGNPFLLSELLVGLVSEDPVRLRESMRSRLDRVIRRIW
jgi:hypothetical protein